jgi:serine/threonine protein kinase
MEMVKQTLGSHGFELREQMGAGANATLFKVWSAAYNQEFAAKIAHIESNHGWEAESQLLRNLCHPNIVRVYATFDDSVLGYLVLEYCSGGDLTEQLKRRQRLKPCEFFSVAKQLLDAVEYVHSCRIAHLDIKPGNILFTVKGHIRLADFGCCRCIDSPPFYGGTEPYMSPEIIEHTPNFNMCRSDIWSLGVVFYVMSVGELPWRNLRGEEMRSAIRVASYNTTALDARALGVVTKMLRPDPDARPSIQELRNLLTNCAKPPPLPGRTPNLMASVSNPACVLIPRRMAGSSRGFLAAHPRLEDAHLSAED